ncbi:ATP-binding protein [Terricaulis sp.]|uniref:sensor histidine kinase n=1 Tax=Terricaulis sp. TaxID=2768686 RepID=UPI003783B0A7
MTLAAKTAAAFVAIFMALFVGAWIILDQAVRPGFERLETQGQHHDETRVQANLQEIAADLGQRVIDYAHWDATSDYFLGRNPGFVEANFYEGWFTEYGIDLLVLADDDGHILWTNDVPAARKAIAQARGRVRGAGATTGVMWDSSRLVQLAVAHPTGNEGLRPSHGYVIFGRALSAAALGRQVQVDLDIINPRTVDRDLTSRFSALVRGEPQSWMDGNTRRSLIPLTGIDGRVNGAVATRHARDISALGMRTAAIALGLFVLISALALATLWLLLRRFVIARIQKLERHLDLQSHAADLQPIEADPAGDEIARLSDAYNALASRMRDSARREQQAELEREAAAAANKMKSGFLANVSYVLRAPMNAIIGYAELIQEELHDQGFERADTDLRRITASARRLLSLINEIFDLSKLEVGRIEATPQAFKVDEMVVSAIDAVRAVAEDEHTKLNIEFSSDLGVAYTDQQRLRQCLVNVLSNCCRFAPGGEVSLSAARRGELLHFEVRDNGRGMTAAELAQAFEPFVETAPDAPGRFGSAGIGLAMTRKLMALLGGEIKATSHRHGGSCFVLEAPATLDDALKRRDELQIDAAA